MKKIVVFFMAILTCLMLFTACDKKIEPTEIEIFSERITGGKIYMVNGNFLQLEVQANPVDADTSDAKWSSSDESVVKIDQTTGKLQGRKVGKATVTVTYKNLSDSVEINVKEGKMIPFSSQASSTDDATIPDKAFDRNLSTFWKSYSENSVISKANEWIQANYQEKREVSRFEFVFHAMTYKPETFEIWASDDASFENYDTLKTVDYGVSGVTFQPTSDENANEENVVNKKVVVELDETVVYQYYRFVFPRTTSTQNFYLIEIEVYAPDVLTK